MSTLLLFTVQRYDTALLFTDGATKLTYKNGTLYTNTEATEGFSVSPEVKVVLSLAKKDKDNKVSEFDKVTDDYTGYSGLETAIRNLDTNFKGDLSAILKNGAATVIVLNDVTGTKVDTGSETVKETGLYSFTTSINAMGTGTMRMTVKRPAWADGAVNYSYDILVNGKYYTTRDVAGDEMAAGVDTDTDAFVIDYLAFDKTDVITVDNFKLTAANIKVKYVDENGKDVAVASGTMEKVAATGETLWFATAGYNATTVSYKVENVTAASASTKLTGTFTANAGGINTADAVIPDGDDFVVVTITGLTKPETTYSVTELTATALNTWTGVDSSDTPDVTVTAGKTSSIKAGTPVVFTLKVATKTSKYAYEVSVAKLGLKLVVAPNSPADVGVTDVKTIAVDKDITIAASDVVVTKIPAAKVTGVSWTATTVTINLDRAVSAVAGGVTEGSIADGATIDKTELSSNGKVITVTMKNGLLAAGDTLNLVASSIKDAYTVELAETNNTIELAADGVATLKTV